MVREEFMPPVSTAVAVPAITKTGELGYEPI